MSLALSDFICCDLIRGRFYGTFFPSKNPEAEDFLLKPTNFEIPIVQRTWSLTVIWSSKKKSHLGPTGAAESPDVTSRSAISGWLNNHPWNNHFGWYTPN